MRKALWRWFIDYEKEETWLNEMSAKGLALIDYFLCRYSFVASAPGEYIYRIELLEHLPSHPESQQYLNFMAENGTEHVASWHRWVYFRRKTEVGAFDIYSDIDSRMAHYKRVGTLFLCIGIAEICIGSGQLGFILNQLMSGNPLTWYSINLLVFGAALIFGIILLLTWNSLRKKAKKLKQAKSVWE